MNNLSDYELAKRLQDMEYNGKHEEENLYKKEVPVNENKGKKRKSAALTDPDWDLLDPNPNIHSLFQTFDKKYFWSTLGSVEVKWSPRMYTCAGICTYKGRGGCVVSLSLPLLKLRPRKDLIETLLHEMIHAYLFLTKRDRDRDGHGPLFHQHMYRINADAGTKITVYHSFHDEVRHYKTHWWRCDGPCQNMKPFFGLVKRAMNRAPGPNDNWYASHQATCGGNFIKIKEPEGFKSRKRKGANQPKDTTLQNITNSKISPKKNKSPTKLQGPSIPGPSKINVPKRAIDFNPPNKQNGGLKVDKPSGMRVNVNGINNAAPHMATTVNKIGGTTSIHGFKSGQTGFCGGLKSNMGGTLIEKPKTMGKEKPGSTKAEENKEVAQEPIIQSFSGTGIRLAPPGTTCDRSKSRLLSLYSTPTVQPPKKPQLFGSLQTNHKKVPPDTKPDHSEHNKLVKPDDKKIQCPVCGISISEAKINEHLDSCVQFDLPEEKIDMKNLPPSPEKSLFANCPNCDKRVYKTKLKEHLDDCIQSDNSINLSETVDLDAPSTSSEMTPASQSPSKDLFSNCPVCDKRVYKNKMDQHLESCMRLDSIMDSSGYEIIVSDDEDVADKFVNCPCCDKPIIPEKMNEHLDVCLQQHSF